MKEPDLFRRSIGVSYGLGFVGIVSLLAMITSLFILWSVSCAGGAAFDLAARIF